MARLAALIDGVFDDLAHPGEHQVPERDTLEHLAPLPVDDLALLVHDVVVLDQIAAGAAGGALRPWLWPLDLFRGQPSRGPLLLPDGPPVHPCFYGLATAEALQC